MINLKYLILIFLVFSWANVNTRVPNNNQTENIMQSKEKIDSKFEKINIEWLEKNGQARKMGDSFSYLYETKTDTGFIQMYGYREKGYSKFVHFNNSYFKVVKHFYPNGNIKEKGWMFNNTSVKVGIWHEYTENGTLSKTINYDELTAFTIEDVFRFCTLENIPLEKGYIKPSTGNHTNINRFFDEETSSWKWYVGWEKRPDLGETVILDAQTGEILSREEYTIYECLILDNEY